jgi:hypothetical protein
VAPYKFLDKVICQWRRKEYSTRLQCGLDPIASSYPGCFPLTGSRSRDLQEEHGRGIRGEASRDEKENETTERLNSRYNFQTVADVIYHNDFHEGDPEATPVQIQMDEVNWDPPDDKDWDTWILEQSNRMKEDDELYHRLRNNDYGGKHSEELHEKYRRLIQGDDLEWYNYWPMVGVRTEYYYRYSGSQTIPPCYGTFVEESREGTNHWRVMKDPIRIQTRQLDELKRLIADRIAPTGDPVSPCQPDTAAKVTRDDVTNEIIDVVAARPLMNLSSTHFSTFCECKDWESKWPEDRAWCRTVDINERFYTTPYNYDQDGF